MSLFKLHLITKRCGFLIFILSLFFLSQCGRIIDGNLTNNPQNTGGGETSSFTLTSTTYSNGGVIPNANACNNKVSPQYSWTNPPAGTVTFALIMDDISCTTVACAHWGVFYIPSGVSSFAEGQNIGSITGASESLNYLAQKGYTGPCPIFSGKHTDKHTYITTIYALNVNSTGLNIPTNERWRRSKFSSDYAANILGTASITGTFTATIPSPP